MGFWGMGKQGGFSHYPVIIKYASDNSWSQRAGRIHGAAGEVDLQWKMGVRERREVNTGQGVLATLSSALPQPNGCPFHGQLSSCYIYKALYPFEAGVICVSLRYLTVKPSGVCLSLLGVLCICPPGGLCVYRFWAFCVSVSRVVCVSVYLPLQRGWSQWP